MEKLAYPEHVRLGYNSNRFLAIKSVSALSSPVMRSRNFDPGGNPQSGSEFDFADVFGGPPRLAAKEASNQKPGEILRNLREKPVFGEESPSRRVSKDFFDDIYGGDGLSSARKQPEKKVAFYSMPGSRILSPTCASPPRTVPLSPVPSLPSRISQFPDLGKGADSPTSTTPACGSPNRYKPSIAEGIPPSPILSVSSPKWQAHGRGNSTRFSVQSVKGQQNHVNDVRSPYRQSRLSHQYSLTNDESLKLAESSGRRTEGDIRVGPIQAGHTSKNLQNSSQFHFSIHKWAGKGATLFMPLKRWDGSREQNTKEVKTNGQKIALDEVRTSDVEKEFLVPSSNQGFFGIDVVSSHDLDPNRKEYQRQQEKKLSDGDPCNTSELDLLKSVENTCLSYRKEASEFQVKKLLSLAENDSVESGKDNTVDQRVDIGKNNIGSRSIYNGQNITKATTAYSFDNAEAEKSAADTIEPNPEGRLRGNRVKGKVKEFIRRFNQEASQKSRPKVDNMVEKSRRKGMESCNAEAKLNASCENIMAEKIAKGSGHSVSTHTPLKIHHILEHEEDCDSHLQFTVHDIHNMSSNGDGISGLCAAQESAEVVHDLSVRPAGDNLPGNGLVESSFNVQEHQTLTAEPEEGVQSLDAKIKKWADGREGNIRSLLSTLQYILWPGSGWKPVALVDIIDGTAVKRTYQKALLCLHPDKLQQKGATVHQKYIAEKIFDILQEAWTHFDLSSL